LASGSKFDVDQAAALKDGRIELSTLAERRPGYASSWLVLPSPSIVFKVRRRRSGCDLSRIFVDGEPVSTTPSRCHDVGTKRSRAKKPLSSERDTRCVLRRFTFRTQAHGPCMGHCRSRNRSRRVSGHRGLRPIPRDLTLASARAPAVVGRDLRRTVKRCRGPIVAGLAVSDERKMDRAGGAEGRALVRSWRGGVAIGCCWSLRAASFIRGASAREPGRVEHVLAGTWKAARSRRSWSCVEELRRLRVGARRPSVCTRLSPKGEGDKRGGQAARISLTRQAEWRDKNSL
jgi:hypothetical protein